MANEPHTPKATGRPWTYDQPATERISVHVTPAQRLELRRVAEENGTVPA